MKLKIFKIKSYIVKDNAKINMTRDLIKTILNNQFKLSEFSENRRSLGTSPPPFYK